MSEEIQDNELTQESAPPAAAPDTEGTTAQVDETQDTPTEDKTEAEEPKPKREPWQQKRIDELTRARREAERENAALRAMLEGKKATSEPPTITDDVITARAKELANVQRLNDASNALANAGRTAYPDFSEAVNAIGQIADLSKRPDFLEAITDLPNGHEVFYALGKDPDEAAHILSLSPVKMAIELAKASAKAARPRAASKAPAPITPLSKSAAPAAGISDDLPMAEWLKRREETARRRR